MSQLGELRRLGQPLAYYDATGLHFEHQDWQGTERMRTSYNGATEASFATLPFGEAEYAVFLDELKRPTPRPLRSNRSYDAR